MANNTILILLPQTSYQNPGNGAPYTVTGDAQPAAAYYLGNKDLQTINYSLSNCTGNILIEASLSSDPTSDLDWFQVFSVSANANASANTDPYINSNAIGYTNISGNFVFVRAVAEDLASGTVNFVRMSY